MQVLTFVLFSILLHLLQPVLVCLQVRMLIITDFTELKINVVISEP